MPTAVSSRVVVDTSVWIDFFRGRLKAATYDSLSAHIRLGVVAITDIIRHEILVGASTMDHYRGLSRLIGTLECLRISDDELKSFDEFAWGLKGHGFKGKYTDAAIAFVCFKHKLPLFTFDRFFKKLGDRGIVSVMDDLAG